MRKVLAAAVAVALLAAGCSKPPVEGIVEHKQHSARVVYYTHPCIVWTQVPYRSGNTTYYTSTCVAWGTRENVIPESWQLCVKGKDEDGKDATGCVEVPASVFARYGEGDHYSLVEAQ